MTVVAAITMVGCGAEDSITLGFGASDVERIEVFAYPYSSSPKNADRWELHDRRDIASVVQGFTDVPVAPLQYTQESLYGKQAGAYRFVMRAGNSVEVARVFLDAHQVVLFWPDGSVVETTWGIPTNIDYFPEALDSLTKVEGTEIPEARFP